MKCFAWLVVALVPGLAWANDKAPVVGTKVASFTLRDYRGAESSLEQFAAKKAVVLAFVGCECPVARLYGPRLAKLAKDYEAKGVQFLGIDANQQDGVSQIARFAKDAGIEFPILKDVNNVLADQLGVQRTTEVLVLDADRIIRYRGRIDDQYNVGISRTKSTQNDLAEALDELLAGKPVSKPTTPAVGCFIGRVHKPAATGTVTFAKDVARIFNKHCVECHHPGEIGPFSLTSYDEAIGWADTIDEVVREGRMPPWHADPKYGHFANDSRLSADEKKTIADWIEAGTPEGDPKDMPAAPTFAAGWRIPKPDVVFTVPKPFKVKATGTIDYQFFVIDTGFTEDKWIQAAEVKPSCRAVVHHVLVFVQPPSEPLVLTPDAFNPQRGRRRSARRRAGGGARGGGRRAVVRGRWSRRRWPATRWPARRQRRRRLHQQVAYRDRARRPTDVAAGGNGQARPRRLQAGDSNPLHRDRRPARGSVLDRPRVRRSQDGPQRSCDRYGGQSPLRDSARRSQLQGRGRARARAG